MEDSKIVLTKKNGKWSVSYDGTESFSGKDRQVVNVVLYRWFQRHYREFIVNRKVKNVDVDQIVTMKKD
jgi:hypothetical protein